MQRRHGLTYQEERNTKKLSSLVVITARHYSDCKEFLVKKRALSPICSTFGVLDPPLGRERQAMVDYIEASLRTNIAFIFDALLWSGLLETILDLFFQYKWNNFLHQSVFNIVTTVLQSPHEKAIRHLIVDCHLIDRILKAESENEEMLSRTNTSYGYIAFLTRLSLLIDGLVQHHPFVREILLSHPDWQKYIHDVLGPRNDRESRLLGGGLRYPAESTDDDDVGDLSHGDDFENWYYERVTDDDDNGEDGSLQELIPREVISCQDDGNDDDDDNDGDDDDDDVGGSGEGTIQDVLYADSEGLSDSDDDETIVQRDFGFDDSDSEDPFPSSGSNSVNSE